MPTISMAPEELESSYNRLKVGILERVCLKQVTLRLQTSYNYSAKLWVQWQRQARKQAELSQKWKKPSLLNKILETTFMQWKHYWCYPCILEQKPSVSSHYFLKLIIFKSEEWKYTTAGYLLTNRYRGLFPWQKRTWDMKVVLKSWMCGALSPNTPHTFIAWCFITKRIDFTLPHNKSHFF